MTIISALPYNLQNNNTADATQVMANINQIRNDVNNNAQPAGNGQSFQIKLTGITTDTAFTLPANSIITGVILYVTAGSLNASPPQIYFSNSSNTYPNIEFTLPLTTYSSGKACTTLNFNAVFNVSGTNLSTLFDLSDGITPGNGFNSATVDVVIQYVTF